MSRESTLCLHNLPGTDTVKINPTDATLVPDVVINNNRSYAELEEIWNQRVWKECG